MSGRLTPTPTNPSHQPPPTCLPEGPVGGLDWGGFDLGGRAEAAPRADGVGRAAELQPEAELSWWVKTDGEFTTHF